MDTLHDRQLTPAQREETFEVMRSDLQRLSDLIDRLLQAQVLMDEHRTLKLELTDLAEETRIAADLLRGAFIHHGIQLDDETEPNLRAMTEPEKWQLLVKNLLDNALKYSQDRGKVSIRLRRNGTYALLIVTDQGIGIEKKELEKIFERFYRIGREETRSTRGTGLGLFLVKRIAESFGGRAWAHSEGIGTGAEFSVEIPLAKEVV